MWIKDLQNKITTQSASLLGFMAAVFIAIAFGLPVTAAVAAIATLVFGEKVMKGYIRLRHCTCLVPRNRIHQMLREQKIFRPLANHLLKVAGVPTKIPAGAINALVLGPGNQVKDGSPLDWIVSWVQLDGHPDKWIWRLTYHRPLGTIQDSNGEWKQLNLPE